MIYQKITEIITTYTNTVLCAALVLNVALLKPYLLKLTKNKLRLAMISWTKYEKNVTLGMDAENARLVYLVKAKYQ